MKIESMTQESSIDSILIERAIHIASIPFIISPNSVMIAGIFPEILNTLVAPGLHDPCCLGSRMPNSLHTIIAVEMEPNRYASNTVPMIIIMC